MIHKNANPHYLAHKFSYLEPKYAGPSRKNEMTKTECEKRAVEYGFVPQGYVEAFHE